MQWRGNRIDKTPRNELAVTGPMVNAPNVFHEQNYQRISFSPSPAHSAGLHPSQTHSRFPCITRSNFTPPTHFPPSTKTRVQEYTPRRHTVSQPNWCVLTSHPNIAISWIIPMTQPSSFAFINLWFFSKSFRTLATWPQYRPVHHIYTHGCRHFFFCILFQLQINISNTGKGIFPSRA